MDTTDIVHAFYQSFQKLDAEAMTRLYDEDVFFQDPAFGSLKGNQAKNMWKMLIESQKGKDFKVQLNSVEKTQAGVKAEWQADYVFSKTGRKVHNVITAHFKLENNLIVEHRDSFNLHKWASQALGMSGVLFGWTPFFKKKLQRQTNRLLLKYEATLA